MQKDVIIACDFKSKDDLDIFLGKFKQQDLFLKIGMEMFYKYGTSLIKELKERKYKIFLDLKLHDIPNTVYGAMRSLSDLNIDIINVHVAGTIEMMKAAKKAFIDTGNNTTKIIAVTQLTSTSQEVLNSELLIPCDMEKTVIHYAQNAQKSMLDGVVCSALEIESIKKMCGKDFCTVVPGIRYPDNDNVDQKRVGTPIFAREKGADYIVVGRPITLSENPTISYEKFKADFIY